MQGTRVMILGLSTGIFFPFFQFIIVALTLWTGCRGWKSHWEDSQHCLYDFKPEVFSAGGTYFASRLSSRGQGAGDEVPGVFRNKARGVEETWTEEWERDPSPAAHRPRLGGAECRLAEWQGLLWGSVPLDRFPQPARPHLDQQICRPGLKTQEKPGKHAPLPAESRLRFVRAASGFPAPPLPLLRDSGSCSRAPRTQFSPLLSLPTRSVPILLFPFLPPSLLPPAPHHHEPPTRLNHDHHDLHHHHHPTDWPTLPGEADCSGEFPAEKQRGPVQRGWLLSWRSRRTPEHLGSRAPDRVCLALGRGQKKGRGWGREKQDPGEGVTVGGDTGDGYRAGSPPPSDSESHPWSAYLPTPEFPSGAPTPHLAIFPRLFPISIEELFRRAK